MRGNIEKIVKIYSEQRLISSFKTWILGDKFSKVEILFFSNFFFLNDFFIKKVLLLFPVMGKVTGWIYTLKPEKTTFMVWVK